MSLRRRIAALFVAAGAVVLVIAILAVLSLRQVNDARADLVRRAQPAQLTLANLLAALADQETGVRGYALTGNVSFLEPYTSGRKDEAELSARLKELVSQDPKAEAQLATAFRRVDAWHQDYVTPTLAAVRSQSGTYNANAALSTSKALFDQVRSSFAALNRSLQQSVAQASRNLDQNGGRLAQLLAASIVVLLAVGIVIAIALRRLITEPLEVVASNIRLVAAGDLNRDIPLVGPTELVGLADDANAMRVRLVDELIESSEAREELARSNTDLEQFAYVASHDLQEPLRKVVSFTQLLQKRYAGELDDTANQYIEFAVDGAQRMQVLISDLLAFSRVGRSEARMTSVDLAICVEDAKRNLSESIAESGATVTVGSLPSVRGDRVLLTALFQNLIGNAVKFRGADPPRITIDAESAEGLWWFSVADNGIGIEPRFADRIFVIFQRLHGRAEYEGTGIGLALTRKVVEHHGGAIWLDTDHPTGARFCFILPTDHHDELPST